MRKRVITVILSASLLIGCVSVNALAKEMTTEEPYAVNFMSDAAIISEIFEASTSELVEENVIFDYDFKVNETNDDHWPIVEMDILLEVDEENYAFTVTGEVERIILENGDTFLQGPLRGEFDVNGKAVETIIGFQNIEGSNDVSLGLSMKMNLEDESKMSFIQLGSTVKTQEIQESIERYQLEKQESMHVLESYSDENMNVEPQNGIDENSLQTAYSTDSNNFEYEGYDFGKIIADSLNTEDGYGSYLQVYTDSVDKRIKAQFKTYSEKFDDSDFPSVFDGDFIAASVYEFRIGLDRTSGTSSYIAGMEDHGFYGYDGETDYLIDIFYDLLSYLNAPTGTITEMFGDAKGKVTTYDTTSHTYLNVKVSLFDEVNFDDNYMPVIFQLDSNSGGTAKYNAYVDLTYLIDCLGCAFYVDCETAEESVTM